jgi:hypothetical protein
MLDDVLISQTVEAVQRYQNLILSRYRAGLAPDSSALETSNNIPTISEEDLSAATTRSSTMACIPSELVSDFMFDELQAWPGETYFDNLILEFEWNLEGTHGADASHELSLEEGFP